ncbi:MAG: CHASE2 domain-containing protein [Waterburya sp.]
MRVIFTIMAGSFEQGFPVILRIYENGQTSETGIQIVGRLPASASILEKFLTWQLAYRQIIVPNSRIKAKRVQITNISWCQLDSDIIIHLNNWLNSTEPEWQKIRDGLHRNLNKDDQIEFIIQTSNTQLRQLPWNLWDFFEHYPYAEPALSNSEYQNQRKSLIPKQVKDKVNILAILGNSQGIDIEQDRIFLEQLSDRAQIKFLVEPKPEELSDRLWEQNWDLLFFAGHSSSLEKGQIYLNKTDSLTIEQLRYALKKAIANGLKLAIFNSCDGLGLAQQLCDLQIPQVIVMREAVPDLVAQTFLKYFLRAYSQGQSLYTSVRQARERLQSLEYQYRYASWLPVICTSSIEGATSWQELLGSDTSNDNPLVNPLLDKKPLLESFTKNLPRLLTASLLITSVILGVRHLGWLQTWELMAFDRFMQLRPNEPQDTRLLLVTVTEEDFQLPEQKSRQGSLSNLGLERILEKLEPYQPSAIGLDIYRDYPVNSGQLANQLKTNNNLFAICRSSDLAANYPGVSPPPEVPPRRLGFSDVIKDRDGVLRRHLLAIKPSPVSPCKTPYALNAQLAFHYLKQQGISSQYNQQGDLQVGKVVFKRLKQHTGGYHRLDDAGYQILLNYRSVGYARSLDKITPSPANIAPTVSLQDLLEGKLNANDIKGKIILIGTTAQSTHDYLATPYSTKQDLEREIPGVIIHAQMVSQILSAVMDGRPLLSVFPIWGDVLWIGSWSLLGGVVVCFFRSKRDLAIAGVTSLVLLSSLSFGLFLQGKWVALVPASIGMLMTGGVVKTVIKQQ